jgi:hypothetical protein
MVVDGVTTYKIISSGGYELNPIVKMFIKFFGLTLGLVAIKGLVIGFIFWIQTPPIVLYGLVIFYIYICHHNIKQLA